MTRNDGGDDGQAIEGTWLPVEAELGGKPFPDDVLKTMNLVVEGGRYTVTVGTTVDQGTLSMDPAVTPRAMKIAGTDGPNKGRTIPAIYELDGDSLRICYDLSGQGPPGEFKTEKDTQLYLVSYTRERR